MKPWPRRTGDIVMTMPILMVFVGEPQCFDEANALNRQHIFNHLAVDNHTLNYCHCYQWPVHGTPVGLLIYGEVTASQEQQMVAVLCRDGAVEVVVRRPPSKTLYIRKRRHG